MRRTIGIALILLGAIGVEICGIVLRNWPLPIPGFIFRRLGTLGFTVDLGSSRKEPVRASELTLDHVPIEPNDFDLDAGVVIAT